MKRSIISLIIFVGYLLLTSTAFSATEESCLVVKLCNVQKEDIRIKRLENFLKKHNSPLAPHAETFIKKADEQRLPEWRLVPAITGVESTYGKVIPKNSYNAYGWANGAYSFKNWEESISVVSKMLREKYYDRGATTPEAIGKIYAPPSTTWAGKVRWVMNQIDNVEVEESTTLLLTL